jgi:hypothetical protein
VADLITVVDITIVINYGFLKVYRLPTYKNYYVKFLAGVHGDTMKAYLVCFEGNHHVHVAKLSIYVKSHFFLNHSLTLILISRAC